MIDNLCQHRHHHCMPLYFFWMAVTVKAARERAEEGGTVESF
jgi:hypothetical protein